MQRKDVERLARLLDALSEDCAHTDSWEDGGATCSASAAALRALLDRAEKAEAERDALQGQLNDLRNGWAKSVKAHAALLAERDAAFAAGQEEMRERAAKAYDAGMAWDTFGAFTRCLRALPIKPRP